MSKILNVRERVHQPYRDSLIRTAGLAAGTLNDQTDLFIQQGRNEGFTNLKTSAQLPNDSSMIILAVRVDQWFRASIIRGAVDGAGNPATNGDIAAFANAAGQPGNGNAVANYHDVYRCHWQCAEGLFWTVGSGEKDSLRSMPSKYFSYGGGLDGDVGGATDLIHFNLGQPSHSAILRLARAVTIVPRQLIKVSVSSVAYPDGGNQALFTSTTGIGRNMLSPVANLNACDAMYKSISCTVDGLVSRDVQ
jgi:hypothetical protein